MTTPSVSSFLNAALDALEEQRNALVSGDAAAIGVAGENLAEALGGLGQVRHELTRAERETLQEAASSLAMNSALLGRASAGNQRALLNLFEPSATYASPGQSGLASPTRTLRTA